MKNQRYEQQVLVALASALGSELMVDNAQYTSRISIKSMSNPSKSYVLSQRKSSLKWLCGCPDFLFNRKQQSPCKHLRAAAILLAQIEAEQQLATQHDRLIEVVAATGTDDESCDEVLRNGTCE